MKGLDGLDQAPINEIHSRHGKTLRLSPQRRTALREDFRGRNEHPEANTKTRLLFRGFRLLEPIFDLSIECSVPPVFCQVFKYSIPEVASV